MTQERAIEVLALGAQWSEYRKHMTEQEIAEVTALWRTMDGRTCFYDALRRVAKGGDATLMEPGPQWAHDRKTGSKGA